MSSDNKISIEKKLDTLIAIAQQQLALDLYRSGMSKEEIGKQLHIAKSKVVSMLKGIERPGKTLEKEWVGQR